MEGKHWKYRSIFFLPTKFLSTAGFPWRIKNSRTHEQKPINILTGRSTNHKKDSALPVVATKFSDVGRKCVQIHSQYSNSQTCNPQFFYSVQCAYFHHFLGVTSNNAKCSVHFIFFWPCISIDPCNENQLDALFIHSLLCQSTSTCFGHICSPSSGGILYIYNNWWIVVLQHVPLYIHNNSPLVVYIQYTSWLWATNMSETCRGWLTK